MELIAIHYPTTNKLHLLIFRNKTTGDIDPVISKSTLSGFVSGRSWERRSVDYKEGKWGITGKMIYSFRGANIFSTDLILNK